VEGGLPKRAAHATSMTHMVTSPKEGWSGRRTPQKRGPCTPIAHMALQHGQIILKKAKKGLKRKKNSEPR